MLNKNQFDVIIVGGSYSGLAAGMALGRALKKVLIIDNGKPCNRQTPYSHNFLTNDGKTPAEIGLAAKQQVARYKTIAFISETVSEGSNIKNGFQIKVASGEIFTAKKLIFATGIKDLLPQINGFADCWGISVLHCPYCHGYEVRNEVTGVLGNGEQAYDFTRLIYNWTKELTLFTNGRSLLSATQTADLTARKIKIIEKEIVSLRHVNGQLKNVSFNDGAQSSLIVLYAPAPFEQQCSMPAEMGCELSSEGYIMVDAFGETTVKGVFACGDNSTKMRTVTNAVATGTTVGIALSKQMILEDF